MLDIQQESIEEARTSAEPARTIEPHAGKNAARDLGGPDQDGVPPARELARDRSEGRDIDPGGNELRVELENDRAVPLGFVVEHQRAEAGERTSRFGFGL